MTILFGLVLLSLVVALGFLVAFFWAVSSGQYEDSYTPSVRILFGDELGKTIEEKDEKINSISK